MAYVEGDFQFDFSAARSVDKLEDKTRRLPQGMSLVDWVVEEDRLRLMVEIKDPSCEPPAPRPDAQAAIKKERERFIQSLTNDSFISEVLVPKARDSYCFLHLMGRDDKRLIYVFLLGDKKLDIDEALLLGFKDRLLSRLRHEAEAPWTREYVTDCMVLTENQWMTIFPQYPLSRLSDIAATAQDVVCKDAAET